MSDSRAHTPNINNATIIEGSYAGRQAVYAIDGIKRRQVKLAHRVQHRPHQNGPPGTQSRTDGGIKNTCSRLTPMNLGSYPQDPD